MSPTQRSLILPSSNAAAFTTPRAEAREFSRRDMLRFAGIGAGMLGTTALLAACGASSTPAAAPTAATATPVRGGLMTVVTDGVMGTGFLDPHAIFTNTSLFDMAHAFTFDQLMLMDKDNNLENVLIEEITPNADGSEWTIRLVEGIEFHNGKTLTADDVIFSLQRMVEVGSPGSSQIGTITEYKKVDDNTLTLVLAEPRGWLDIGLADGGLMAMVPVDFDPLNPVGTGPFKFKSFEDGVGATFERFDNYHGTAAYLDELVVQCVNDPSARLNALVSGEADVAYKVTGSQVAQIQGNSGLRLYSSPTGSFIPFQMRVQDGPFSNADLRQAVRYAVDRQQVVSSAYADQAQIGSDLYAIYDPDNPASALETTRERDLDMAKDFAAKSGIGSTEITLTTMQTGSEQAQVLAQNAQEAGINIVVNVVDPGTLYDQYNDFEFMTGDYFPNNRYLTSSSVLDGPGSALGRFPDDEYGALWSQASATFDSSLRSELIGQMQEIQFDRGPFIIPAFYNEMAGMSANTTGWDEQNVTGLGIPRAMGKVGFTE